MTSLNKSSSYGSKFDGFYERQVVIYRQIATEAGYLIKATSAGSENTAS